MDGTISSALQPIACKLSADTTSTKNRSVYQNPTGSVFTQYPGPVALDVKIPVLPVSLRVRRKKTCVLKFFIELPTKILVRFVVCFQSFSNECHLHL